jgi:ubiquinone/menaquinone biosynthesis C-methylase UbiE
MSKANTPPPRLVFTTKAEKYARYRWDYAPQAVEAIYQQTGLNPGSTLVDLGAGTGILTRHFSGGLIARLVAIEPDLNMLRHAPAEGCLRLAGQAEAIPLPTASVDVICVATAVHWFEPQAARVEMQRVLKPGGWLALVINNSDDAIGQALSQISTPEYGVVISSTKPDRQKPPISFYFEHGKYQQLQFPFSFDVGWDTFIGSLTSTSYMPDESHPLYPRFEAACREVFARFSTAGRIPVNGQTELLIGRMGHFPS